MNSVMYFLRYVQQHCEDFGYEPKGEVNQRLLTTLTLLETVLR